MAYDSVQEGRCASTNRGSRKVLSSRNLEPLNVPKRTALSTEDLNDEVWRKFLGECGNRSGELWERP